MRSFLLVLLLITPLAAEFTPDFGRWLSETFGDDVRQHLERLDLGKGRIVRRATASERADQGASAFPWRSSVPVDVSGYATTYANGAQGNPLQWAQYSMECSYVKTVRALIVAVRLYTGRSVDVIGYSLGICNMKTGLYSGFCPSESEYLQDINRVMGYEGVHRFSIYSMADQIITSAIPGQHGNFTYTDKNHDNT
ncbi:hypothetical protein M3Y99_00168500 [Aphelenchoides fujianensis]|nr:hypothetical protein M3Y99_00168500 [Aphelenchoides fujianensis]